MAAFFNAVNLSVDGDSLVYMRIPSKWKPSNMSFAQGPRGPAYWFRRRTLSAHANARPKKSLCAKINLLTGNTLSCREFFFKNDKTKWFSNRLNFTHWLDRSNSLSLCFQNYGRTCTPPSAHQFMRMILSLAWQWHVRIVSGAETGGRGLAAPER